MPFRLHLILCAAALADGEHDDANVIAAGAIGKSLDDFAAGLAREGASGTMLVAKGGAIVFCRGIGSADREQGIACTPTTVYDIGSITKQFTAAAILKLEMAHKLAVTDPIDKFLGKVPADKHPITLHHLLTHSAGLIDNLGGDYEAMTRDAMIEGALASKLLWPPGTSYQYSNLGYSILAAIIEIVSGQGYEEFLHEQLFEPAGMTRTGYVLPVWRTDEVAVGYERGKRWGTPLDHAWDNDGPYWNLRGNGGILANARDMYRWHQALLGNQILSAEAKQKLYAPHVSEGVGAKSHYGYGWSIVTTDRNTRLIWHNGGNGIFFADFWRYLDEGITIFLATNDAPRMRGRNLTAEIAKIVRTAP